MDMYILYCGMVSLNLFLMGAWLGYWLRKQDEADGVVSALKTALDERRVSPAVMQQVVYSCDSVQLLNWARWKLQHNVRCGKGSAEDFARCRSIASRIMRIKPTK